MDEKTKVDILNAIQGCKDDIIEKSREKIANCKIADYPLFLEAERLVQKERDAKLDAISDLGQKLMDIIYKKH